MQDDSYPRQFVPWTFVAKLDFSHLSVEQILFTFMFDPSFVKLAVPIQILLESKYFSAVIWVSFHDRD